MDLMEKLEKQATEEKSEKGFCDTNMKKAVTQRDTQQAKLEEFKGQITGKEAKKKQLKADVVELSKEIAALKKELMEASELRQGEKEENAKTVKDASAGKAAVQSALQVLKDYYEKAALLQRSSYTPKDADRDGVSVADAAPEVFDSEYKGSQQASKGILGLLEVILSDFDRTVTTVTKEEKEAEGKFQTYKKENEKNAGENQKAVGQKEGLITGIEGKFQTYKKENEKNAGEKQKAVGQKEGLITGIEGDLVKLTDDLNQSTELHSAAEKELEVLSKKCVEGEESYEDRVAARQKEIESLKEAHNM